jgi:hypothetical protein
VVVTIPVVAFLPELLVLFIDVVAFLEAVPVFLQ